jgi:hypothetical protein
MKAKEAAIPPILFIIPRSVQIRTVATKRIILPEDVDDGIRICLGTASTACVLPRKEHIPENLASSRYQCRCNIGCQKYSPIGRTRSWSRWDSVCWQGRCFRVEQCKKDGRETGDEELGYDDENVVNALFKEDINIHLEAHTTRMERKQKRTHTKIIPAFALNVPGLFLSPFSLTPALPPPLTTSYPSSSSLPSLGERRFIWLNCALELLNTRLRSSLRASSSSLPSDSSPPGRNTSRSLSPLVRGRVRVSVRRILPALSIVCVAGSVRMASAS